MEAKFLTGERVTKAFYVDGRNGLGFLVEDHWHDPVVRSEYQWQGFMFLRMKMEAMEEMNLSIRVEPAVTAAEEPSWPTVSSDDDMDVHVGLHSEMVTPRRQRPNKEPGLMVGRLYLDGCFASSGTGWDSLQCRVSGAAVGSNA